MDDFEPPGVVAGIRIEEVTWPIRPANDVAECVDKVPVSEEGRGLVWLLAATCCSDEAGPCLGSIYLIAVRHLKLCYR